MNLITGLSPNALRKAADIQEKIQALQDEMNEILQGGGTAPSEPTEAPKKKRKMSAAGRRAIAAGAKARWAKIKGTAASAEPAQKPKRKMSAQGLANIRAGVKARWAKAKKAKKMAR